MLKIKKGRKPNLAPPSDGADKKMEFQEKLFKVYAQEDTDEEEKEDIEKDDDLDEVDLDDDEEEPEEDIEEDI